MFSLYPIPSGLFKDHDSDPSSPPDALPPHYTQLSLGSFLQHPNKLSLLPIVTQKPLDATALMNIALFIC